jgi:hypothetical protein
MSNDSSQPEGPEKEKRSIPGIIWLLCAFVPSAVAISCLQIKNAGEWLLPFLVILDIGCSFAAAIGLLRNMEKKVLRAILTMLLAAFFFAMNVIITLFVGCSGMGRMAP